VKFSQEPNTGVYYYYIRIDHILLRLRFPRYILHAQQRYHDEGEYIIEELLQNGRMTLSQFLQQPISSKSHIEQRGASLIEKDKLKNTFIEMIQSHYIMRAESNFPDADKQVEAKSKMDDPKPNAKNKPNSKSKKKQAEVAINPNDITNLDQRFTLPTSLIGEKRKYSEDEVEDNISSTVISDDMEIFLTSTTTTVSTQSVAKKVKKK